MAKRMIRHQKTSKEQCTREQLTITLTRLSSLILTTRRLQLYNSAMAVVQTLKVRHGVQYIQGMMSLVFALLLAGVQRQNTQNLLVSLYVNV